MKGTSTSYKNSKHDPIPREQLLIPLGPYDRHNGRCRSCICSSKGQPTTHGSRAKVSKGLVTRGRRVSNRSFIGVDG